MNTSIVDIEKEHYRSDSFTVFIAKNGKLDAIYGLNIADLRRLHESINALLFDCARENPFPTIQRNRRPAQVGQE